MGQTVASIRGLERLVDLVKTLRSDAGCPWDRAQNPGKIKVYLIEEAYEVLDALESGSDDEICAELGDLLFHIVFLARLFEETGAFDMGDVIERIVEKMIRRHPHVFGKARVTGVEDVKSQWQEIKAAESQHGGRRKQFSALDGVPTGLPILMRAYRLVERASRVGFKFSGINDGIADIYDEMAALKDALDRRKDEEYAEKLGDLLFGIVTLSTSLGVHPETALRQAVARFVRQFEHMETLGGQQGRSTASVSQEEMGRKREKGRRDV